MRSLLLLCLITLLLLPLPCRAQGEYSAPTRESYDFERLAREAALVLFVDVTAIDAERSGRMIRGGEGSVVDFRATVREAVKGEVVSPDVVIRAVGHRFFQSGRLLSGPALFFVKAASGEKDGRPVYEIVDPFGKFFLRAHEEDEVNRILAAAERAVELAEPVREGDPSLAPPMKIRKKKRPQAESAPASPPAAEGPAVEAPAPIAPAPPPSAPAADPVGEFLSGAASDYPPVPPPPPPAERPVPIIEESDETPADEPRD